MAQIPDLDEMFDIAELFKIFGDSTRIRILFALFPPCSDKERGKAGIRHPEERLDERELSVGELADTLGMTQSAVSHQLKILRQAHLIKARRDGKQIFYSLADEHVYRIIDAGREHIEEE